MLSGIRTGTFTVFEHECGVVSNLTNQTQRLLMVFFRFIMVSHKDIGRDTAIGYNAMNSLYLLQIVLTGIFSVHEFQNLITSTLCREMDMVAEVGFFCDSL